MLGEITFPAIDPVLFELFGPLAIRWYGIAYVLGFFAGHYLLVRLARARFLPLSEERVGELLVWLIVGVLVGGRLGYVLFYKPDYLKNPLQLFQVWEGGMSFHGGLLGVAIACWSFVRKHRLAFGRVGDALALAVTPGIFLVRLANFFNGELYGRVVTGEGPAWAMRFPTDPKAVAVLEVANLAQRDREKRILSAFRDGTWEQVKEQVPLRHPSQVYEALGEGVLLGLVLLTVYLLTRRRQLGGGSFGGLFLLGYGLFRFVVEFYRQPDEHLGTVLGPFSMGQILCTAMVLAGAWLLVWGLRHRQEPAAAEAQPG